ncbi:MAG TPA: LysM domain-containing protein, partial [Candidatus Limnocylindrales bacterium]
RALPDRSRRDRAAVGQARPVAHGERGRDPDDPTPAWERPHRFEAYPSIRSRVVLSSVPRVALGALALVVAAILLLILPGFFFSKNEPAALASPTASASASASVAPTNSPAATPLTYTVAKGDTLIKIAQKFKTTQKALQAANPSLKNANVITIGQVLVIPTPPPPDVIKSSSAPSPSKSAAP